MWVATYREGHKSSSEGFEEADVAVDSTVLQNTLTALSKMVPTLDSLWDNLLFSSYAGTKVDHPEGAQTWHIEDAGIDNLRVVWPVLWGLTHGAGAELVRELSRSKLTLPSSVKPARRLDAADPPLQTGVPVGEERRLSSRQKWQTIGEWRSIHRLSI